MTGNKKNRGVKEPVSTSDVLKLPFYCDKVYPSPNRGYHSQVWQTLEQPPPQAYTLAVEKQGYLVQLLKYPALALEKDFGKGNRGRWRQFSDIKLFSLSIFITLKQGLMVEGQRTGSLRMRLTS